MKLTLKQIAESVAALQHLMDCKLPAMTSYKLQRTIRVLLAEAETFYNVRNQLVMKYGDPAEGQPGSYKVRDKDLLAYSDEMEELVKTEIELDLRPVRLSELEGADLSVRDMLLLDYMIVEETP